MGKTMGKSTMVLIAIFGSGLVLMAVLGIVWMNAHNTEVGLRNTITAKQRDNQSEMDNMWKLIAQVAEVTQADRESLTKLFVKHAQGRKMGGNQMMTWVKESVPQVDSSTYKNLQNIITGSRDAWTMRQKELLDLKREHDNVIDKFPSSIFVGGRGKIDVTIVTSGRTEKAFDTGKDDNVGVFGK